MQFKTSFEQIRDESFQHEVESRLQEINFLKSQLLDNSYIHYSAAKKPKVEIAMKFKTLLQ